MTDFLDFLKNKTVQRQFLYALVGIIALLIFIFLTIRVYTRHGQAIAVPDFTNMTFEEASSAADEKQLEVEIIDSLFVGGQKPGSVLSQNPSAGSLVKAGRTVFIKINASNPEKIDMPNLVGVPIRQAEAMIQNKGLRLGFKHYKPDIARDFVLSQQSEGRNVRAGSPIVKGAIIDLVIGLGAGNSSTAVPNIKGLRRNDAQDILSNNYLNFGALIYDHSIQTRMDTLTAVIVNQKPTSGSSIGAGMSIDVWLSKPESAEVKDSVKN